MQRSGQFINLCLLLLAVVSLSFRPMITYYRSSGQAGVPQDPDRVQRMMQRLIKKKNDSHSAEGEDIVIINGIKQFLLPPVMFLLLFSKDALLASLLAAGLFSLARNTIFRVTPSNHFYRFICRFSI